MAQGDRVTSSLARTRAIALVGLDGNIVDVETHVGRGLVNFTLVGLPDASLREARDRVRSALQACELEVLDRHVTVGLSPAGLPKSGSGFDFSIAASILLATSKIQSTGVAGEVFIGELALDGSLHTLPGILPAVISARRSGITRVFVPLEARSEAQLVPGIEVCAFAHLADFVQAFGGQAKRARVLGLAAQESVIKNAGEEGMRSGGVGDFSQVRGHNSAIEAVAIAASGGHHLMMIGEPGSGKTMMASRLPSILPELEQSDALTASAIHSIAGDLSSGQLLTEPPFQAPHHSMSIPAMVGGGSGVIRPGAASLAHAGILFLDEATEFAPAVLDSLRQPLESGWVRIQRSGHTARYPASFQLVMATNPCPCGHLGGRIRSCSCSSIQRRRYLARLSGPLIDRIDITLSMRVPSQADLACESHFNSHSLKDKVCEARERAAHRLKGTQWRLNRDVAGSWIRSLHPPSDQILSMIDHSVDQGRLSMRGADRLLRLMWTCADYSGKNSIGLDEFSAALQLRQGGENYGIG